MTTLAEQVEALDNSTEQILRYIKIAGREGAGTFEAIQERLIELCNKTLIDSYKLSDELDKTYLLPEQADKAMLALRNYEIQVKMGALLPNLRGAVTDLRNNYLTDSNIKERMFRAVHDFMLIEINHNNKAKEEFNTIKRKEKEYKQKGLDRRDLYFGDGI